MSKLEFNSKMKLLIKSMFRIGCIGFGGGNALVPVIGREVVDNGELVDEAEYEKDIIVANITPGALPVELASGIGHKSCGGWGMIFGAVAMALPGAILTYLLIALFTIAEEPVVQQIRFAAVGITGMIVFLLVSYAVQTVQSKPAHSRERWVSIGLIGLVFALTCGDDLNEIFSFTDANVFAVSTINVLAITFFIIFFTGGRKHIPKIIVAVIISVAYLMSVGGVGMMSSLYVKRSIMLVMFVLGAYGLIMSIVGGRGGLRKFPYRRIFRGSVAWIGFIGILCIPAIVLVPGALGFIKNAIISVFLSFGGGDAYVVISKGLFVSTDMISKSEFYGQIVTISNAMPGSILAKILTGVGFCIGKQTSGIAAFACALAGFACGVGASGWTFMIVYNIYDRFEQLDIFRVIKTYIRPIIGGLLLTVAITFVETNIEFGTDYGISVPVILGLCAVILALVFYLRVFKNSRLITLIVSTALCSVVVCNLIYFL